MATKNATPKTLFPFDTDQFIAVQQRNVDAMTSASQVVVDGAKAIGLRQSEMMKSSVEDWLATSQRTFNGKPGEVEAGDYVGKAKTSYETMVNNTKELTDIAVKAQSEAFGVLTRAMVANLDDMKSLTKVA